MAAFYALARERQAHLREELARRRAVTRRTQARVLISKKAVPLPIRLSHVVVHPGRTRAENLREERASADRNRQGSWPI